LIDAGQLLRHKLEHFGQRRAGGHVELSADVERDRQPQFLNVRLDQFGEVVQGAPFVWRRG
jgi:hypothetical protein